MQGVPTACGSRLRARAASRPTTRRSRAGSSAPERCCSASSRPTSLASSARASTCLRRRRSIRGSRTISPAARRRARPLRSRPAWCARDRDRHRRLDPQPGRLLRRRRPEADIRARVAQRRVSAFAEPRSCRPDQRHRRGGGASRLTRSPDTTARDPAGSAAATPPRARLGQASRACASPMPATGSRETPRSCPRSCPQWTTRSRSSACSARASRKSRCPTTPRWKRRAR